VQVDALALGAVADRVLIVTGSWDGVVQVGDAEIGPLHTLTGLGMVTNVAVVESDGGPSVVTCGDSEWNVWEAASGKLRHTLDTRSGRGAVAEVAGRPLVATAGLEVWDAGSGRRVSDLEGDWKSTVFENVALAEAGGRTLVTATALGDDLVRVWDVDSGELVTVVACGEDCSIECVTLGERTGRALLVAGDLSGAAHVWDAMSGEVLYTLRGYEDPDASVDEVVLSGSGDRGLAATFASDGGVCVWDLDEGGLLHRLVADVDLYRPLALGEVRGRHLLVTGAFGAFGTFFVWDAVSGVLLQRLDGGGSRMVHKCAMIEVDGMPLVATATQEGVVRLWGP
jgi:WD40 repeat protein